MGENQLRYNTEINHEHFHKYRNLPAKNEPFPLGIEFFPKPRSLLFGPNDKYMVSKTVDGIVYGSIPGLTAGIIMVNHETQFRGPLKTTLPTMAEIFFKYATPCVISGGVYGLVTSASTNIRKKEDFVNNMIGGICAGSVFGMWYKNSLMTFWGALILGMAAGWGKYCTDTDSFSKGEIRRPRVFNMYRRTWFTDPIPVEGTDDDEYKDYRP